MLSQPTLRILGTRGIPAKHGGFETFAERLAHHLVARGWRVIVYCQEERGGVMEQDDWRGIERVRFPVRMPGALGTIVFDWRATLHAARHRDLCLTLGYNTAVFGLLLRAKGVVNITNMDGIEWSRAKWGHLAKAWFRLNEWIGCISSSHLVADHPQIKSHLQRWVPTEAITTIAYGADRLAGLSQDPVLALGLQPGRYITLIARPEPENSILEVVSAFSKRARGVRLLVLGQYLESNPYHRKVRSAASAEVVFAGAIYDQTVVRALRGHCLAYVHGHQVGGTNPSLVEAMGAGNAVIAHDNRFNRWVCCADTLFFTDADSFANALEVVLADPALAARMRAGSVSRFEKQFTWPSILGEYERLLTAWSFEKRS